jgi:hypothetical protein
MKTLLKRGLLKLRCRIRLFRGAKLENGLTISIARLTLQKHARLREVCAQKCRHVEKMLETSLCTRTDMKLYAALENFKYWHYRNVYVVTFNLPSIPIHTIFNVENDSDFESLVKTLVSMRLKNAFDYCDAIIFNNVIVSNEDASIPFVLTAIKNNVDLPVARLICD